MKRAKAALATVAAAVLLSGGLAIGAAAEPAAAAPTAPTAAVGGDPGAAPAIVGGTKVSAKRYPWLMAIYMKGKFSCAGVLIAPTKVLTAGHCGHRYRAPRQLRVVQGRNDVRGSGGTTYRVKSVTVHPRFAYVHRHEIMRGDVAVLTLATRVANTRPVRYVGPGDTGVYKAGTRATILGWGRPSVHGEPGHLRKATVPLVSDTRCRHAYGADNLSSRDLFCAGNWKTGGVDACGHDSGGPLLIHGEVAGIVSGGVSCARPYNPGTYARLTTFSRWVSSH
ncbi:DUF1986 domain-containing protein [Streptomyces sp. TP-A0356]|uniref:S1 family peptidase n=1 Tax=Streptomyces sp. TP-A0356 TaxID=1359208 RepID=UPI00099EC98F|nr:serine protease [Streptomyces sp. TP-A0356]